MSFTQLEVLEEFVEASGMRATQASQEAVLWRIRLRHLAKRREWYRDPWNHRKVVAYRKEYLSRPDRAEYNRKKAIEWYWKNAEYKKAKMRDEWHNDPAKRAKRQAYERSPERKAAKAALAKRYWETDAGKAARARHDAKRRGKPRKK